MALDVGAHQTGGVDLGENQGAFVPASITLSPVSGFQGTGVPVTVTGTATHFATGSTTVSVSGSGVAASPPVVASTTSLTVAFAIGSTAAATARTVTVATGSEAPAATFTVSAFTVSQRGNLDYNQVRGVAREGAGAQFQMFGGGTVTSGHVAVYDASENVIDGGYGLGALPIRGVSVNTTMVNSDYTVIATVPSITITLPASPAIGQVFNVKNANPTVGQLITVAAAVNIDISTSISLGATASLHVQYDGTQFRIL
jgi:hypothetical protein